MLNITQIVYEKPLSTPYKKGHIHHQKSKKMKLEKELTKYLNEALELTGDYLTVLSLIEMNPEEILEIESRELRSIASLIYICRDILTFIDHEVCYNGRKFKVELITKKTPF